MEEDSWRRRKRVGIGVMDERNSDSFWESESKGIFCPVLPG